MKAGIATAARMPMIATTIINSMRVNPRLACLMSFIVETESNGCAAANCPDLRQGDAATCRGMSLAQRKTACRRGGGPQKNPRLPPPRCEADCPANRGGSNCGYGTELNA